MFEYFRVKEAIHFKFIMEKIANKCLLVYSDKFMCLCKMFTRVYLKIYGS